MKISESGSDNAKFLSEFLFWTLVIYRNRAIQYNTINQSTNSHQRYGSGAPRPARTISSITSSFASRLYVRMVSPKSEMSYIRILRSKLSWMSAKMIPVRELVTNTHPTFPYPAKELNYQREHIVKGVSACMNHDHAPATTEAKPYSLHSSAVVRD